MRFLVQGQTSKPKFIENEDDAVDHGLLLLDSDQCSLSTKIHYAQLAGVSLLLIKYIDDSIDEAEIERSTFSGVKIPVMLVKDSDAGYIYDVLNSADSEENKMVLDVQYLSGVDMSLRTIDIYMNSTPLNNPVIKFLHDLMEHHHLVSNFKLNVHFVLGQCAKCREKNFMFKEKGCLGGGRYCVVDSNFPKNSLVLETLRQICVRQKYSPQTLIKYLWNMKKTIDIDISLGQWQPKNLELYSWRVMGRLGINLEWVKKCFNGSFKLVGTDGRTRVNGRRGQGAGGPRAGRQCAFGGGAEGLLQNHPV